MAKNFTNRYSMSAIVVAMIAVVISATVVMSGTAEAKGPRPFMGDASGVFIANGGEGVINATHLGEGTVVFSGLTLDEGNPEFSGLPIACFPVTAGLQTFTAANGDELHMSYDDGTFCADVTNGPPGMPHHGDFITNVTGGTGRFEGATGQIIINAVGGFDGTNVTFSSKFGADSWIDY